MDGGGAEQASWWRENGSFFRLLLLLAPIGGLLYYAACRSVIRAASFTPESAAFAYFVETAALYLWLVVQATVGAFWLRDKKDFLGRAVHPGVWTLAMFLPYLSTLAALLLIWRLSALTLREYRPLRPKP